MMPDLKTGSLAKQTRSLLLLLLLCGCGRSSSDDRGAQLEAPRQERALLSDATIETSRRAAPQAYSEPSPQQLTFPDHSSQPMQRRNANLGSGGAVVADPAGGSAPPTPYAGDNLIEAHQSYPATAAMESAPRIQISASESINAPPWPAATLDSPNAGLPAGARRNSENGFATVEVYYATDRQRGALPLSAYEVTGQKQTLVALGGCSLLLLVWAGVSILGRRTRTAALASTMAGATGCLALALVIAGQANIEKHGVTYTGDRGALARGVCEVTVPDSHRRGLVERPSLLRFELRENQQEHIVLTSAVELSETDFHKRLSETVANCPAQDLLVFIHGYNVDFQSAVRRTAQIAVDLPFEGVPVCYSWPSQGSLIGYSIDENNSEWTIPNLKQFLLELAEQSGAKSINVVAHSMGNRAMTAAMQQISWQHPRENQQPASFDRIVLAAPDVDADRFRRDLAPALLNVANQVTLYASSDDQALVASRKVHGYPRAGDSGANLVVVPGVETIDVSGIDLSLLGHSYYGDNEAMLRDLYELVHARLPAPQRRLLVARRLGELMYWQLAQRTEASAQLPTR